jgi:hypothetical protein
LGKTGINQHYVDRIAERIVSKELEYRGFWGLVALCWF